MDPHCGWCYANGSNVEHVYKTFKENLEFELIPGGMWLDESAPIGGANLSQFIGNHAPRLIEMTGAVLSDEYYSLVENQEYTFSSLEPSAAIEAVRLIS